MRFYKYRGITNDLAKDKALDALAGSYAIFSSKRNFNDLVDGKIDLPRPTPEQLYKLLQGPGIASHGAIIKSWISIKGFTSSGVAALNDFESGLNEKINSYPIYCLSESDRDMLLWAHYASQHTGFCIEFETEGDQPTRVSYQEFLPSIPLLDFIKDFYHFGEASPDFGIKILDALHVKLACWCYEAEHRFIASNNMGRFPQGETVMKVAYKPSWVRAVIFGCRTSDEVRTYIRNNVPFKTTFKQAIERNGSIEIVLC
jgi:hypothetical protein